MTLLAYSTRLVEHPLCYQAGLHIKRLTARKPCQILDQVNPYPGNPVGRVSVDQCMKAATNHTLL